jgi:hypothetical protein
MAKSEIAQSNAQPQTSNLEVRKIKQREISRLCSKWKSIIEKAREQFMKMMSADFTPRRVTSPIVKARADTALDRFDNFFILHFDAMQIGADAA